MTRPPERHTTTQHPRYRVTYTLTGKTYMFCTPAPNAAHVFRTWDRPAKLVNVVEVDRNNIEVNP